MTTALANPVWKAISFTRSTNGETYEVTIAHAVRGTHTLCGLTAWTLAWLPEPGDEVHPQCRACRAVPEGHTTRYDMEALGITYRQLDYWVRQGYLQTTEPPQGSGHRRTFPPSEIAVVKAMAAYTAAGISPLAAHHAARHDGWLTDTVRVTVSDKE